MKKEFKAILIGNWNRRLTDTRYVAVDVKLCTSDPLRVAEETLEAVYDEFVRDPWLATADVMDGMFWMGDDLMRFEAHKVIFSSVGFRKSFTMYKIKTLQSSGTYPDKIDDLETC